MEFKNNDKYYPEHSQIVDFDIHGIVGIRLIDPSPEDSAKVKSRLGIYQASLDRAADITIRYTDEPLAENLVYLGLNSSGFTNEGFYILDEKDGSAIARVPFDQIGTHCEILCRRGIDSIPLFFDIIRLSLISKNYIPLHASAFLFDEKGVLVTGWTKGGKSESLLSFANHGASYVGDEWVVLSSDGQEMFGLPINIAIWEWQFNQIPDLMPKVNFQKKAEFTTIRFLDAVYQFMKRKNFEKYLSLEIFGLGLPFLRRGLKIRVSPKDIFGSRIYHLPVNSDKVFLAMSHNNSEITIEECDPIEIVQRMTSSIEYEQTKFFEYYKTFKFAFPQSRNKFLDNLNDVQSSLLHQALAGKEAYKVLHPYPVSFEDLYQNMEPYCTNNHGTTQLVNHARVEIVDVQSTN